MPRITFYLKMMVSCTLVSRITESALKLNLRHKNSKTLDNPHRKSNQSLIDLRLSTKWVEWNSGIRLVYVILREFM